MKDTDAIEKVENVLRSVPGFPIVDEDGAYIWNAELAQEPVDEFVAPATAIPEKSCNEQIESSS